MTQEELTKLTQDNIPSLLKKHEDDDPVDFALRYQNNANIPIRAMAEQISCYKKAKKKLPQLSQNMLLYESLAIEQCSSEATALYKKEIMNGERLFDCTGGLGIDTLLMSDVFKKIWYCDINPVLADLIDINSAKLNILNIKSHAGDSIEYLSQFPNCHFDWIYIDPSRRDSTRRYIKFEECKPDIIANTELFFQKSQRICIKAAPAFDLTEAEKKLTGLYESQIISVNGECREILFLLSVNKKEDSHHTIKSVLLKTDGTILSQYQKISGTHYQRECAKTPMQYFYEPDSAILKAQLSNTVAEQYAMKFINTSIDYLTSENIIKEFPGRVFKIIDWMPWQRKQVLLYLKQHNITYGNIARRDFPLAPEGIRHMLKLRDGGIHYLFFTRNLKGMPICIICKKTVSCGN